MNNVFRVKKRLKYLNLEKKKFLFDKIINAKIDLNSTVFDKWTHALSAHFTKHGKKNYVYKKIKNELINFYTDFINQKSIFWIIAFNESHKRPDYMFRVFQQKFIYNNWGITKFFQNKKFKNDKKELNKKFQIYEYDNIKEYKNTNIKQYYDFSRFVSIFFSKKIYRKMISFSKKYSKRRKNLKKKKVYEVKNHFFTNKVSERVIFKSFFKKFKKNNKNFFFNTTDSFDKSGFGKINFNDIKASSLFFKEKFNIKKKLYKNLKFKTIAKIKKISRNKKYIKINNKKVFFVKPKKYIYYFFQKNNVFKWIKKNDYISFDSKFMFIKINKLSNWSKLNKIKLFNNINKLIKSKVNKSNIVYWHFFFSQLRKKKFINKKNIIFNQKNNSNCKINYMYKKFDCFFFWKKKSKEIKNKIFKIVPNNKVKYKVKQIMIPELGKFLIVERKYKNVSYKNFFIDFIKLVSPSIKIFKQQRNRGNAYYVYYGRKVPDFYDHQKFVFNIFKDLVNKNENYNHLVRNPKKPKKKIISIKPKKSKRVNTTFSERFYSEFSKFINFEGEVFSKFDEFGRVFQKRKSNKHYRWELNLKILL